MKRNFIYYFFLNYSLIYLFFILWLQKNLLYYFIILSYNIFLFIIYNLFYCLIIVPVVAV
uniref:NADH dehydrogenase subunit 4L n=1 Tax=Pleurobrachia bachei TaxID=34499 RepID=G9HTH4_PLEBA|nr:NADH dehydrogenase subunit 4L [Pleurobrachia bachei]